jgi:septum formation protein
MMRLVLASASPRRADLLRQIELPFSIEPSPSAEPLPDGQSPDVFAVHSAHSKARSVFELLRARGMAEETLVIGADTVVCVDDVILGKPAGPEQAEEMLGRLSGHSHRVYTGMSLISAQGERSGFEVTEVIMKRLSRGDIDAYVASGEPLDKAGAYGIQGRAGRFIESIAGCYYNVVGLPLARLCTLLEEMGYDVTAALGRDKT